MTKRDMQWLTGFFEGDGCAYAGKAMKGMKGIIFVQKDSSVLEYIQKSLGCGSLTMVINGPYRSHRLCISSKKHCRELLEIFRRYVVSSYSLVRMKKLANRVGLDNKDWQVHSPTIPWAVGFWDAEGVALAGTVQHYKNTRLAISIGVKDEQLLRCLRDKIGGYVIGGEEYQRKGVCPYLGLQGKDARRFILDILEHSHHLEKKMRLLEKIKAISLKKKSDCAWTRFFGYLRESTIYYKVNLQSTMGGGSYQ